MITYTSSVQFRDEEKLDGFFVGWPKPPSPAILKRMLSGSRHAIVAIDTECSRVVGFITILSDGVLSAYIPLLEVLPAYQGRGIGTELVRRALALVEHLYMIDLTCDANLQSFYRRLGFEPSTRMSLRNYHVLATDEIPVGNDENRPHG